MRNLNFLRIFAILKRIFTKITKKIFFFNTLSVLRPIERVLRTPPPPLFSLFCVAPPQSSIFKPCGASHYNTNSRRVQLRNLFRFVCCTVHMHSAKQKKILRDFLFFYSFSFYKILASAFRSLITKDPFIKIIYYIA